MVRASSTRARKRFGAVAVVLALVAASLAVTAGSSSAGVNPTPTALTFVPPEGTQPGGGVAGAAWAAQPKVAIVDVNGDIVTTSTAQVFLHITPTDIQPDEEGATLTCTTNPVTAVAGVATFAGCSVNRVGSFTLTAEAPSIGLAKMSASFSITPGPPTKLGFVQQPGHGTENLPLTTQPWVAVQDAFGNTVTTDDTTEITLVITNNPPGNGNLDCANVSLPVTDGVAKFANCDIDEAGTGYTLGATATGLTGATSAPFDVSFDTITGLAFVTQPGSSQPGDAIPTFRVAFVDALGRTVTDGNEQITVAIDNDASAGTAVLSVCTNPATPVLGVATFTNCEIDLPGVGYTLSADSASEDPVESAPFTIGILHLAFIAQPGNGTAGNPLSVQPQVAIRDASSQIQSSNSDQIELSLAPGTGTPGATLTCAKNPLGAVGGIAAFALCEVDKAGIGYRITATDLSLGISANSGLFNVVGPPASLAFITQPGNGAVGLPFSTQPVVEVRDEVGQRVTTDNTTGVTLEITDGTPVTGGPGNLDCDPVTVVAGVATFDDCSIDTLGTDYRLTATSAPTLAEDESNTFDVTGLQRIFGPDAIDTSVEISEQMFPDDDSADAAVVARSDFFSDALAGGPLAEQVNGPLLITPGASMSSTLDPRVLAEIQRVLPAGRTVYLLGGPLALSTGIDTQLANLGYVVVRVAGANLFSTAVAIAERLGNPSTIFLATGLNFPDALSAVPAAILSNGAILLTNGTTQAPETAAYLAAHPPTTKYAIGGPLAAAGADPTATPVFGQDLFGTSAAVATRFFPAPAVFGVATGLNYPDALSGGVFMATDGRLGPVLLVSTHVPIPPTIATYLAGLPTIPGFIFGGPLAVGNDVEAAIVALL